MLKIWETVFRRRLPFSLRKNTHGKFAEKFGEKIRRKKIVSLRFSLCFLLFSGHPILRAFLNPQIEKIRAESVLQEISLNTKWKFPELRQEFFGDFPRSSLTLEIQFEKIIITPFPLQPARKSNSIKLESVSASVIFG